MAYYATRDVELLKLPKLKQLLEDPAIQVDVFDGKQTYVALKRSSEIALSLCAKCSKYIASSTGTLRLDPYR